jgi:hypothetical protein
MKWINAFGFQTYKESKSNVCVRGNERMREWENERYQEWEQRVVWHKQWRAQPTLAVSCALRIFPLALWCPGDLRTRTHRFS